MKHEKRRRYLTTALFLNIKDVFGSIKHQTILNALSEVGINGHLVYWITNNIKDRTIYAPTGMGGSAAHAVTRGVPPGGVLSNALFNISLIDIAKSLPKSAKHPHYFDNICPWSRLSHSAMLLRDHKTLQTLF